MSRVGQWGVYSLVKGCCSGYGEVILDEKGMVEIDQSERRYTIGISESKVTFFPNREEASQYFGGEVGKRPCQNSTRGKEVCTLSCPVL